MPGQAVVMISSELAEYLYTNWAVCLPPVVLPPPFDGALAALARLALRDAERSNQVARAWTRSSTCFRWLEVLFDGTRQYPEPVTVKAWLNGHQFDLEALAELFPTGNVRVGKEGDEYYLAATEIDSPPDGREFYHVAPEVLQRVNGMARAMRPNDYQPVELVGRYQVGENRHHVIQTDSVGIRDQAVVVGSATLQVRARLTADATVTRNGESTPQPPPSGPRYLALAAQHSDVVEALATIGKAEPNWAELYKVYEIVRDNIKPAKMEDKGWATKPEQNKFTRSANHPDVSGTDARHARTSAEPPARTMSLNQARQFIGDLVVRWIDALQP